jgi:hypothetical protein
MGACARFLKRTGRNFKKGRAHFFWVRVSFSNCSPKIVHGIEEHQVRCRKEIISYEQ